MKKNKKDINDINKMLKDEKYYLENGYFKETNLFKNVINTNVINRLSKKDLDKVFKILNKIK